MTAFLFLIFIFGLIFGSFLNALLYRLEKEEDFVRGRSHCPKCQKQLYWYDNIPLFSFLFLRGKCRFCGKSISWRYPLGELLVASLGVLTVAVIGSKFELLNESFYWGRVLFGFYVLSLVAVLVGVFLYDLKHYLIPDELLIWGGVTAFLFNIGEDWARDWPGFAWSWSFLVQTETGSGILGALLAGGLFFLMVYFSHEKWMGWGDVKLGILMGILLGFWGVVTALFLAYWTGAIISVFLVLIKKKKFKSEVPFGPFLCGATWVAWLWGSEIMGWYLRILNFEF